VVTAVGAEDGPAAVVADAIVVVAMAVEAVAVAQVAVAVALVVTAVLATDPSLPNGDKRYAKKQFFFVILRALRG
jgi:hypothetical protein